MSRKDKEKKERQMEKINFFPFVHGDQIEQHRENINS